MIQIDMELFEKHVDNYKDLVYSICISFVRNPYDAEDLAQETFVAAYRSFSKFDNKNPKSWFATIAANKCRDFLKSPARRVSLVETGDLEYISDTSLSIEEEIERDISERQAYEICSRLKEPYRSVALAYYCNDEKISDISARTGDNQKTVATRLYRAKKLIKIIMKEEGT